MAKARKFYMSRDVVGGANANVFIWKGRPQTMAGEFREPGKKSLELEVDSFPALCGEFVRFCKNFDVKPPEPGELIEITIKAQSVVTLSSAKDVAKRLRAAKRHDPALLQEAAAWVESQDDNEDDKKDDF